MAFNSTRTILFILPPTIIMIILAIVFMDTLRLSAMVRDIVNDQRNISIDSGLLGKQPSVEQEEKLLRFISEPANFTALLNRVRDLREGNLEERHAAAVIAEMLAKREPTKEVIALMDNYLATPEIFDVIVGCSMFLAMIENQTNDKVDLIDNQHRIKGIEAGLALLDLNYLSTSEVLTISKKILSDQH